MQVGVAIGCLRINKMLIWLNLSEEKEFQVFHQFLSATNCLPIGNERLLWATEALLQQDTKLSAVEAKFRPAILSACIVIIATYG